MMTVKNMVGRKMALLTGLKSSGGLQPKKMLRNLALVLCLFAVIGCSAVSQKVGIGSTATQAGLEGIPVTRGDISAAVTLVGNVTYAQSAVILWKTTGVVQNVNVKIGDQVKQDDILAELSEDSLNSSVLIAEKNLIDAQDNLTNVMESTTAKSEALSTLTAAEITYQATKQAQEALYYPRGSQLDVEMAYDAYQLALENYNYAKEDYRVVLANYKGWDDAARTTYYQAYKTAYDNLISTYEDWKYLSGTPDNVELASAQGEVLSAQKAFQDALDTYSSYQTLPRDEDLHEANVTVHSAESSFQQRYAIAPFSGTVTAVYAEPGLYVTSGNSAFQLDDMSEYYISLDTSEVDVKDIYAGQKVQITLDAIPNTTFSGIVKQVAGAGTSSTTNTVFKTLIKFDQQDPQIKAGMTAEVNIFFGTKEDVLQVPLSAINQENGRSYVLKINGAETQKIEVTTGVTSGNLIEVDSDELKEGDQVVVSETDLQNYLNSLTETMTTPQIVESSEGTSLAPIGTFQPVGSGTPAAPIGTFQPQKTGMNPGRPAGTRPAFSGTPYPPNMNKTENNG